MREYICMYDFSDGMKQVLCNCWIISYSDASYYRLPTCKLQNKQASETDSI